MKTASPLPTGDLRASRGALRAIPAALWASACPVLCGALLALGWRAWTSRERAFAPGPVRAWVADRDGGALIGLDGDLFVAQRVAVPYPVEVEARPGGGAWVAAALEGWPGGEHELRALAADGTVQGAWRLGPVLDLAGWEDGVVAIEAPSEEAPRVLGASTDLGLRPLASVPGARCAAAAAGLVLVGAASGEALLLDAARPAAPLARRRFAAALADLEPGPEPGTWWALESGSPSVLHMLGAELAPRWSAAVGFETRHLAPCAGAERVWLAAVGDASARRFGPGGALEIDVRALALAGLDRAQALPGGGALLAAPGAVLRLDADGRAEPGQGGFDFVVDVAWIDTDP